MILLMEEIPNNHLECIKARKYLEKLPINWCRISSINSILVEWVRAMSGCFDLTDMPRISFTKLGYIPMIPLTDYSTPWITDKKDSPKGFWAGNHHIWISRFFFQKFNGSKMEHKFISPIKKSNSNICDGIFLAACWCGSSQIAMAEIPTDH